jgi:hypothetical protein
VVLKGRVGTGGDLWEGDVRILPILTVEGYKDKIMVSLDGRPEYSRQGDDGPFIVTNLRNPGVQAGVQPGVQQDMTPRILLFLNKEQLRKE